MDDEPLTAGIIYVGYGEVMHKLQVIELNLWQIQALRMKAGTNDAQAFAKVQKWDATTFGALYRGMKQQDHWPERLIWKVGQAVELRNYLAHHLLREFFLTAESQANYERGANRLIRWLQLVSDLDAELELHAKSLGGQDFGDLDDVTKAAIDAVRPESWPFNDEATTSYNAPEPEEP